MAEQTNNPAKAVADPSESKAASPMGSKPGEVVVGSKVHLVHFHFGHIEAVVTRLVGARLIDLKAVDPRTGRELVITRSPRDDSCTRPDSWHLIEKK